MRLERMLDRVFGGHVSIGRLTVFGRNAMHWGVTFQTRRWGYLCFRLPLRCFGRWWPLYFYCSPNATPWAATFYLGGSAYGNSRGVRAAARERRKAFGHNFDTDAHSCALRALNDRSVAVSARRHTVRVELMFNGGEWRECEFETLSWVQVREGADWVDTRNLTGRYPLIPGRAS